MCDYMYGLYLGLHFVSIVVLLFLISKEHVYFHILCLLLYVHTYLTYIYTYVHTYLQVAYNLHKYLCAFLAKYTYVHAYLIL